MAGRRRQPGGDGSRQTCEEDPKARTGDRETPKSSGRRLSRSTRAGAVSAQPRSDREEETSSSKKTPKRFSRSKPWMSTINSPSNDAEQQQDIFWDPHSPTTFKLENGKKKPAANKCTVDISDIVNRIAPKDEKPSCSDAAYLGIWIGEDAIPCTPVVARARTKLHRPRILHTEEELMKLAMQLDSNLVKQKDHSEDQLAGSDDEMFSEYNAVNDEEDSFLEDLPEGNDLTLVLKPASQRSPPQRSSQRSVDPDAEADLNALFDSETQKYSGCLSQGLSDVSASSLNDPPLKVRSKDCEMASEKPKRSEQSRLPSKIFTPSFQGVKKCSEQNNGKEKETVQSLSSSQDDFEDDWDNDLLEDDSFIMQVTQNPELIATPKNSMSHNKADQMNAQRPNTEIKSTGISSSSTKANSYKFVPRKVNGGSEVKPSNLCSTETTIVKTFQDLGPPTRLPSKPQTIAGGQMAKNNVRNLVPATNSTLIKPSHTPCAQTAPQTRAVTVKKDSVIHDEWDDPKFSDEVLDMFCQSDSLWEGKEEDDDLLYQVCDDVERLTQAQEIGEENPKRDSPQLPSSTCQLLPKMGTRSGQQSKHGSHVPSGSAFSSHKLNNRGISPASFSGNCSSAYQNCSLQKSNQAFSRSSSVPSGGELENTILPSTDSQNPVKSLATTCSVTSTLAPSKYSFTRLKPSQVTSVHTGNWSAHSGLRPQSFGDSKTNMDGLRKPQESSLKRHRSESVIQSSKVFAPEDKNKKCSMEEIERKKREALARRNMKARACSGDIAPT